jgi:hypothetical protein
MKEPDAMVEGFAVAGSDVGFPFERNPYSSKHAKS